MQPWDGTAQVGLSNLTDCTTEDHSKPGDDDYKPAQAGTDGMQIFEKVYSMRYRRKLFPVSNRADRQDKMFLQLVQVSPG